MGGIFARLTVGGYIVLRRTRRGIVGTTGTVEPHTVQERGTIKTPIRWNA